MESKIQHNINIPLIVDLDGTFLNTDLLVEGISLLIKKNILAVFSLLIWLFKGIVVLKSKVFEQVQLNYETLPVNEKLFGILNSEFQSGRKLILATASPKWVADEIGNLYPIFTEIYGSDNTVNLKGNNKRDYLIEKFGKGGFDYIGNSNADVTVFKYCRYSYLVNPSKRTEQKTKEVSTLKDVWRTNGNSIISYLKLIRIHQWSKNLLILLPVITSHSFHSISIFKNAIIAFFAFSFIASAGYIINDILDLNADRSHPRKRFRVLASGDVSFLSGLILTIILVAAGIYLSFFLRGAFSLILISYFVISIIYSVSLKQIALYDVFLLASFYTIRVIAGGVVTDIPISFWLITFSIFVFLSLAFVKRYSEIIQLDLDVQKNRRDYSPYDIPFLQIMGICSGFISVVVFTLYLNSPEVSLIYSKPHLLWVISLLMLFWISRIWLKTSRGKMNDDPIVYIMKDPTSMILMVFMALTIVFSI